MIDNKKILSKNLNHYLTLKCESGTQVAKKLNMSQKTFSGWTSSRTYPRIEALQELADYFGVPKSYLIEDIDYKNINLAEVLNNLKNLNDKQLKLVNDFINNIKDLKID